MKSLDDIMYECGHTDKTYKTNIAHAHPITGEMMLHSYANFYGPILNSRRHTVANVLEIGVWRGGSLSGWANYFDNANVYGFDTINMFDINKHDGVDLTLPDNATFICDDAYNAEVLQKHFGQIKFDVIIDDGPHSRDSQLFTLNYFHDKMRKNGVIFIEDVGSWNDYNIECEYIYDNFQGDKNYLSVIDRIRNPHHEWNEYIIMYYAE